MKRLITFAIWGATTIAPILILKQDLGPVLSLMIGFMGLVPFLFLVKMFSDEEA